MHDSSRDRSLVSSGNSCIPSLCRMHPPTPSPPVKGRNIPRPTRHLPPPWSQHVSKRSPLAASLVSRAGHNRCKAYEKRIMVQRLPHGPQNVPSVERTDHLKQLPHPNADNPDFQGLVDCLQPSCLHHSSRWFFPSLILLHAPCSRPMWSSNPAMVLLMAVKYARLICYCPYA